MWFDFYPEMKMAAQHSLSGLGVAVIGTFSKGRDQRWGFPLQQSGARMKAAGICSQVQQLLCI